MLDFIDRKADCTGCGACLNVCSVDGISMFIDEEGFAYPEKNDHCFNCGACSYVCPLKSDRVRAFPDIDQYACAAITKDRYLWRASSSGGAFSEICRVFGGGQAAIFGALAKERKVIHTYVVGYNQIGAFRKSKYLQSDIGFSFRDVKMKLEKGTPVLFSGTPCQIAGLRSYLKKDYENLLCIDFICHGVGSPAVFQVFLDYIELNYGSRVINYTFRVKNIRSINFGTYVSRYLLENRKSVYVENDEYNQMYLKQLCLRPCCGENCRFRNKERLSDLTIADFHGMSKVFPEIKDNRNYSTIIVNSKKGNSFFKLLNKKMKVLSCSLDDVIKYNPLYCKSAQGNPLRDTFFCDFIEGKDFGYLARIYTARIIKRRWYDIIKIMVPFKVRRWIKDVL